MKKALYTILVILILALIGGIAYWYFYTQNPNKTPEKVTPSEETAFSPFDQTTPTQTNTMEEPVQQATTTEPADTSYHQPKLRQLSSTPVAGISASSTSDSSIVRYIDRGTGHLYEANSMSSGISKISNTTIPKIYEAYGNKMGNAFIFRYLKDGTDMITNFYAELRKTGTSTTKTPFELKGRYLSGNIDQVAVSPKGDRIFTWNIEGDKGMGYISSFDEKSKIKVADTPLTQVTIDWPEASTVTINTKASSVSSGFIYTIDTKTGKMRSVLSGIKGLTGKMSADLTKLLYSRRTTTNFATAILNTKDNSSQEVVFKTLSDKCVWSTLRKNEIYCAVPTEIPDAVYPDDWYKGKVSFVDQIWYLNTTTGEVTLMANLLKLSNQLIDATKLTLDADENSLYFINKRDLTLWALDLNQ